ncbi:MAG: right-handed parallel beta-helix repeat-containing protein [Planctomycetota bacterium]|jgi:hypothetical protein
MKKIIIANLALLLAAAASAPAATRHVPDEYPTIQAAIDDSSDGDIIVIQPNTYTGPGNRDIDFLGKAVTIRSIDPYDPHIVAATIIDCNGSETEPHQGFYFHNNEDSNSVLDGLTIIRGYGTMMQIWGQVMPAGGALLCDASGPTIANCVINDSYAGYGGGIFCHAADPTFINCLITGNHALYGAGMFNYDASKPLITNCEFSNNSVSDRGRGGAILNDESDPMLTYCLFIDNEGGSAGGAVCNYDCSAVFTNCDFKSNSAPRMLLTGGGGGAVYNSSGAPKFTNCIFAANRAGWGGAMSNVGSAPEVTDCTLAANPGAIVNWMDDCHPKLTNCILWNGGNEVLNKINATITITYTDVQDGWPGLGNIDADPCFAQPGYWDANGTPDYPWDDFWVDGDYHLLPDSPCINAGNPEYSAGPDETDLDGQPRVMGDRVDMGVDEFAVEAAMKLTPRALNTHSKGKWLKARLLLPEGLTVDDVDADAPALLRFLAVEIESDHMNVFANKDGSVEVQAAFDRADFFDAAQHIGSASVTVTVEAFLTSGRPICGTAKIKIIDKAHN